MSGRLLVFALVSVAVFGQFPDDRTAPPDLGPLWTVQPAEVGMAGPSLTASPSRLIGDELSQLPSVKDAARQKALMAPPPPRNNDSGPAGTISADALRHRPSRKAAKILKQAMKDSRAGNHVKAIEELRRALEEPSAAAYGHSLLGAEYLRTKQLPEALTELTAAIRLLPHDVADRANLGYALYVAGNKQEGEAEVRRAFEQDRHNPQTRMLLNAMLQARGEALEK